MGRSVSKSTLGTWLTKKAWLSLAAVVVGLLAASIGMSLPGSSVVSAQSNSAPEIYSHSRPNSVTVGVRERWQATATDVDSNIIGWRWFLDDVKQKEYTFLPSRSATRVIDHTFSTAGNYTIKSEFFDEGGLTGSVSWPVEVTAPPSVSRVSPSSVEADEDLETISKWQVATGDGTTGVRTQAVAIRCSSTPFCRSVPEQHGTWRAMLESVPQPTGAQDTACAQNRPTSPRRCVGCVADSRVWRRLDDPKDCHTPCPSTGAVGHPR